MRPTAWLAAAALAGGLATLAGGLGAARGGEAQDRIFRTGLLAGMAEGQALVYARERGGDLAGGGAAPIVDGTVTITVEPPDAASGAKGRAARVELRAGDDLIGRSVLSADGGQPMLLVFLESTARAVAELTGGSPFYIKNRMREALTAEIPLAAGDVEAGGGAVPAATVTVRPFAGDPNRDRMGALADLALTLAMSEATPGGFARLEAEAGPDATGAPAYFDRVVFERLEEDGDAAD